MPDLSHFHQFTYDAKIVVGAFGSTGSTLRYFLNFLAFVPFVANCYCSLKCCGDCEIRTLCRD